MEEKNCFPFTVGPGKKCRTLMVLITWRHRQGLRKRVLRILTVAQTQKGSTCHMHAASPRPATMTIIAGKQCQQSRCFCEQHSVCSTDLMRQNKSTFDRQQVEQEGRVFLVSQAGRTSTLTLLIKAERDTQAEHQRQLTAYVMFTCSSVALQLV